MIMAFSGLCIDFETFNEQPSSVCSVGVVKVVEGEIVDLFYSLIYPEPDYCQWFCSTALILRKESCIS